MNTRVQQIRSFAEPKTILGKAAQFPLVRTIIAILFVVVPAVLLRKLFDLGLDATSEPAISWLRDIFAVVRMVVAIYCYRLYTRVIEKRPAMEMSLTSSASEAGLGIATGAALMTVMVVLLWSLSYYRLESVGPLTVVIHAFFYFGFVAFMEEVVFRVILFRHIEELTGSWGAIIVSGLLFGFLHAWNPNATWWSSTAISLQSVIISGCFLLTRRVWLVWGLHVGWNYFQSTVFGAAVSGSSEFESVLVPSISGPEWLTGGAFGFEGSYVTTALCFAAGIWLIVKARRAGQLVGPMWARKAGRHTMNTA